MKQMRKCPLSTNVLEIHFILAKLFSPFLCLKASQGKQSDQERVWWEVDGGAVWWDAGSLHPLKRADPEKHSRMETYPAGSTGDLKHVLQRADLRGLALQAKFGHVGT